MDPFLVPERPYARGGLHFTNGETWIEQYAKRRGVAAGAQPAFRSASAKAGNYAVGGARARPVDGNVHLSVQVALYLQRVGGAAPPDAWHVIEMGSNDIRDALQSGDPAPLVAAAEAIAANIAELADAGARRFLVWNAPNLGLTPAIAALGPQAAGFADFLSLTFNFHLDTALAALPPGLEIVRLDAYQALADVVADAEAFDLADVTSACLTPNVPPFACRNPDAYLFWDGIHPTRAAHAILAGKAAALFGE